MEYMNKHTMTYINLSLFSIFIRFVIPIRDLLVEIFSSLFSLILYNKFILICLILLSIITILLILSTYLKILDRQQYDNTNIKIDTLPIYLEYKKPDLSVMSPTERDYCLAIIKKYAPEYFATLQ